MRLRRTLRRLRNALMEWAGCALTALLAKFGRSRPKDERSLVDDKEDRLEAESDPQIRSSEWTCDAIDAARLERLVALPTGVRYCEWTAVHLLEFFHHINVLFGSLNGELCTNESCPQMTVTQNDCLLWVDEKGKKCKYSAPQYVDCVMSLVEKTLASEEAFPTKFGRNFSSDFNLTAHKLFRLLYNVLDHVHSRHWRHLRVLDVQRQASTLGEHFLIFASRHGTLDAELSADLLRQLRAPSSGTASDDPPRDDRCQWRCDTGELLSSADVRQKLLELRSPGGASSE